MEAWEDMDGSPASIEKARQVLTEQLLEQAKVTAGHVAGRSSLHCVAPKRRCSLKQPECGTCSLKRKCWRPESISPRGTSMVEGLKQMLPQSS